MIRIRSDESLFIVSRETIGKFPESDIYKIINGQNVKNNYIHKDEKDESITLYIDSDPDIMKTIIKMMRGQNINLEAHADSDLLKMTLERLNLQHLHSLSHKSLLLSEGFVEQSQEGGNNSDSFVDTLTLGIGTETQNKIETIFGNVTKQNHLSDELTEFSSDVAKSLDVSINKKSRKIRPKFLNLVN